MKRNSHVFQFSAGAIAEAARNEGLYHAERVMWWKAEQEKAIAKAREAGVEVREYEHTDGKGVEVVLDPTVSRRLTECATKMVTHRSAADRFRIEADAYGTQPPERVYDIDPDDVVYFRLAGGTREEV